VTFYPGGGAVVNGHLNLWRGWGIEEKQGNWRPILAHIVHVICDGNRVFAQYLVRWIAWSVQNPALQAEVLVALIGGKGTGKGTLGHVLQLMFRPHTFKVTSSDQVVGRFNAHLEGCVMLIVDEAFWGGDPRAVGKLQAMITKTPSQSRRRGSTLLKCRIVCM
jgi:Family of unknown function (DUF5906)